MAAWDLCRDRRRSKAENRAESQRLMCCGGVEPVWLLSAEQASRRSRKTGSRVAGPGTADGAETAGVWISTDHGGAATAGLAGESKASAAADAGRQSAVFAKAAVGADDQQSTWAADLCEPGRRDGSEKSEPAMGSRHHLYPLAV